MFSVDEIRVLDIETTNNCNALCPQCSRTPSNGAIVQYGDFIDINVFKNRLSPKFLSHIDKINFNGNTGDNAMHPDIIEFCKYCIENSPGDISLMTNGSMRDQSFWSDLGKLFNIKRTKVIFALDGLADTHSLYRVNTDWELVVDHAKSFIAAGGQAVWQMILFEHNQHQIDQCREMASNLGFAHFDLIKSNRFNKTGQLKVYKKGEYLHTIAQSTSMDEAITRFDPIKAYDTISFRDIKISCKSQNTKWLSIYADGTVWPCCHLMGYHKINSGQWLLPIKAHMKKYFELGDYSKINFYNYELSDIVNSDFFQTVLPTTFKKNPNPVCMLVCSK